MLPEGPPLLCVRTMALDVLCDPPVPFLGLNPINFSILPLHKSPSLLGGLFGGHLGLGEGLLCFGAGESWGDLVV